VYYYRDLGMNRDFVERYADIDGNVPEPGDDWRTMRFSWGQDHPFYHRQRLEVAEAAALQLGPESYSARSVPKLKKAYEDSIAYRDNVWWPAHVAAAVKATERAIKAEALYRAGVIGRFRFSRGLIDDWEWDKAVDGWLLDATVPALCRYCCMVAAGDTCEHGKMSVLAATGYI
jgi:hypothetical protein